MSRRMCWSAPAAAVALAALLLGAVAVQASSPLTKHLRQEIVRTADLPGPNGRTVRGPGCIAGRLSTVNRRWASALLTNTPKCVRRYGGATGEAFLLKRRRPGARTWRLRGRIGANCEHHTGGAPDRVLRDLGCGLFF